MAGCFPTESSVFHGAGLRLPVLCALWFGRSVWWCRNDQEYRMFGWACNRQQELPARLVTGVGNAYFFTGSGVQQGGCAAVLDGDLQET